MLLFVSIAVIAAVGVIVITTVGTGGSSNNSLLLDNILYSPSWKNARAECFPLVLLFKTAK